MLKKSYLIIAILNSFNTAFCAHLPKGSSPATRTALKRKAESPNPSTTEMATVMKELLSQAARQPAFEETVSKVADASIAFLGLGLGASAPVCEDTKLIAAEAAVAGYLLSQHEEKKREEDHLRILATERAKRAELERELALAQAKSAGLERELALAQAKKVEKLNKPQIGKVYFVDQKNPWEPLWKSNLPDCIKRSFTDK